MDMGDRLGLKCSDAGANIATLVFWFIFLHNISMKLHEFLFLHITRKFKQERNRQDSNMHRNSLFLAGTIDFFIFLIVVKCF